MQNHSSTKVKRWKEVPNYTGIRLINYSPFALSEFTARMDKEGGQKTDGGSKHKMDKEAASRIQSSQAKQHGGGVEKGSFAARAESTAD